MHDDPVEPQRETAVGRRPVLEGLQQEAELPLGLFRPDPEHREDLPLQLGLVDPDAAAPQLRPVVHQIVGPRAHLERVAAQLLQIVQVERRERVVARHRLAALGIAFEQRELGHPEEPVPRFHRLQPDGQVSSQGVQRAVRHRVARRHDHQKVAVDRRQTLAQPCDLRTRQMLDESTL